MSEPRVTVTLGAGRVARKPLSRRPPAIKGLYQGRQGMYSDQITTERRLKDRLGESADGQTGIRARLKGLGDNGVSQPIIRKRQRQEDDKWQHDLYNATTSDGGGRAALVGDLRSRLSRRPAGAIRVGNSGNARDLREKLSGIAMDTGGRAAPPAKQRRLTSIVGSGQVDAAPSPVATRVTQPVKPANTQSRLPNSTKTVASFLTSLGLAKYVAAFQAEEVDMQALQHFRDEDLKEMGIPMGPRKKILLSLKPEGSS